MDVKYFEARITEIESRYANPDSISSMNAKRKRSVDLDADLGYSPIRISYGHFGRDDA